MEQKKLNSRVLLLWGGIMAAGTVLLFTGITNESLWYDESYTGALVRRTMADIIRITSGDNHPPLYYLMLRVFTLIFGNTVFSLRAFSVIGALLLASLGIGPVRRALGERVGILYTILSLTMPITIAMAQEARMYTWAAFLVTGSALYGYFSYEEGKFKDWVLFCVFSVAAALTHYYALLAVIIICALVLLMMLIKKKKTLPFLHAAAVMAVSYIPWFVKLIGAMNRVKESYWITTVTSNVIQNTFSYPFSNKFCIPLSESFPAFCYMIAAIILSWGILSKIFQKDKKVILPIIALGTYLLTIIAGIIASWVIRPVLVERYMVNVLGLFILALSYAMANLGKKITPTIVALVLILTVSGLQIHHTLTNRFNGPMKEAVQTLEVQPGDIFLHTDEHTIGTFSYYYPDNMNYYYVGKGTGGFSNFDAFQPNGVLVSSLDEIPKDQQIWLVYRQGGIDRISVPSWINSGKLKTQGGPRVFRLPLSFYDFMVYQAKFPQEGSENTQPATATVGSITVKANRFRKGSGKAIVVIYNGPNQILNTQSAEIMDGMIEVSFKDLMFGDYSVLVFHDENGNMDLDLKNGNPTEGLGYSNQFTKIAGPPDFENNRFSLSAEVLSIDIPIFYFD
ncbi:MAG: DUF2141 domain-containing protein [Ruminiclostridium sp.]|nr:DUF2141 domain-containing protein [Ruminiclostridium sp.]